MRNKAWNKIHQVSMEIWNSKSNSNIYFDFKVKFGVFSKVNFGQACIISKLTKSKVMHKSEMKQGSYVCLKWTNQRRILSLKLVTRIWNGFWSFRTQRNARKLLVDAKFEQEAHISPTYEFEIDLELTQISNSTTGDWVSVSKHVKTSSKCLHPIQNASYSFRTRNFWLFMTFLCNKWSMGVCHMLSYWIYYINSLSTRSSFSKV